MAAKVRRGINAMSIDAMMRVMLNDDFQDVTLLNPKFRKLLIR